MGAEEQRQQKFDRMTKTPIPRLIGELAVPTIISMLVTSFYNMADTFFVGKINTSATAAVGIVFPLMAMIQAFGFFCGHGSGNYISRQLGAHNFEDASKMSATGFVTAFVLGLGILVVGFLFTDPLLHIMGSTETILPYARSYMRIILIGAPYMTASLVLNNQLRFQGSAFYSMIGITTGAVLNIVLDPLFIFVLDMGVAGAALATIISQFVSFCLLIAGTFRGGNLRLNLRDFSPSLKYYQNIVKGGAPSLFRQGLGSFATVCLNLMAGPYGDAAIAAMSIVTRISQFAASVVIGFGQGFQPVCGFNYGAKLFKRVQEGFWFCVKFCTSVLLVAAVCGWIFSPNLIGIFLKTDPLVIEYGSQALRLQALTFPLVGWITIANMMLQTIGKTVKASLLAMSRQFLFFVPVILTLPGFLGILGVQLSQPIADFCSFLLAVPLSISVLREMSHEQEQLEQLKITREN
ncbi:MAG: MATE family efflux transporter [Negativibacillus sp.]|nr:MATE family efflux transporter [Clostridium sp.]MEE0783675.1 MATE family efflux transporter [Negativibacillus sp.]